MNNKKHIKIISTKYILFKSQLICCHYYDKVVVEIVQGIFVPTYYFLRCILYLIRYTNLVHVQLFLNI